MFRCQLQLRTNMSNKAALSVMTSDVFKAKL